MTEFLLFLSVLGNIVLLYFAYSERATRLGFEQQAEIERAILRQAMYLHGRVSAVEIAARSNFPLALIEIKLREMTANNQCMSELDEQGRAIYVFPQFDDLEVRREATEREILLTARRHGGQISVEQLAMETDLTIEQSRAWLNSLTERGACIPDNGRYKFQQLTRSS